LRTALATEGVFAPPLNELKLGVITTEDFNIIKGLIGSYTLKDVFNPELAIKIIVIRIYLFNIMLLTRNLILFQII
jgi:hypothetical protein